jgi:hypothetical protein
LTDLASSAPLRRWVPAATTRFVRRAISIIRRPSMMLWLIGFSQ